MNKTKSQAQLFWTFFIKFRPRINPRHDRRRTLMRTLIILSLSVKGFHNGEDKRAYFFFKNNWPT